MALKLFNIILMKRNDNGNGNNDNGVFSKRGIDASDDWLVICKPDDDDIYSLMVTIIDQYNDVKPFSDDDEENIDDDDDWNNVWYLLRNEEKKPIPTIPILLMIVNDDKI